MVPPVTLTDTGEMRKAGRHHKGQKPCSRPKARERFPCLWSKLCCKSLGSPGTETKHMQVQGGGQARGEYVSEMRELPGRTPARETTRRQSPVWSGDQQPWEVPRRSPGSRGALGLFPLCRRAGERGSELCPCTGAHLCGACACRWNGQSESQGVHLGTWDQRGFKVHAHSWV